VTGEISLVSPRRLVHREGTINTPIFTAEGSFDVMERACWTVEI
jgi:hypothetical protein